LPSQRVVSWSRQRQFGTAKRRSASKGSTTQAASKGSPTQAASKGSPAQIGEQGLPDAGDEQGLPGAGGDPAVPASGIDGVRDDDGMRDLELDWAAAVRGAGATADEAAVTAAGEELVARWRAPERRYHDAEHLAEVLDGVDALAAFARDVAAVRLAAWFHDAVYEGRPGDDEQRSADLAEQVLTALGVPEQRVGEVRRLVLLTAGHDPAPGDDDGAVLSDADLAILASEPQRYGRYVRAVREEYAHVPEELFRAGRAAVLRALDAAPQLYRTAAARERWEAAARANLGAELTALGAL
jgi:predicted metal-dependent HD superfamily phosphohydrolase